MNEDQKLDPDVEFYETVYKGYMESGEPFHWEIPQNYFNRKTAKEFLSELYEYNYDHNDAYETLKVRITPAYCEYVVLEMTSVPLLKRSAASFLIKYNKYSRISFPHYFWPIVYKYAKIMKGKMKGSYITGEV